MGEIKTKATSQKVEDFLDAIESEEKRKDAYTVLEIMKQITGQKPVMWGSSIVGFDKYHYKSERSSQEGDWPIIGFSPRKANITLYVISGMEGEKDIVAKLGKCKTSVGCLYIKKLSDVNMSVLKELIEKEYKHNVAKLKKP